MPFLAFVVLFLLLFFRWMLLCYNGGLFFVWYILELFYHGDYCFFFSYLSFLSSLFFFFWLLKLRFLWWFRLYFANLFFCQRFRRLWLDSNWTNRNGLHLFEMRVLWKNKLTGVKGFIKLFIKFEFSFDWLNTFLNIIILLKIVGQFWWRFLFSISVVDLYYLALLQLIIHFYVLEGYLLLYMIWWLFWMCRSWRWLLF